MTVDVGATVEVMVVTGEEEVAKTPESEEDGRPLAEEHAPIRSAATNATRAVIDRCMV